MKKKLALLMAAIMTVAMVPMTAFAKATTDINAVDQISTAVDEKFVSRVELENDELNANVNNIGENFDVVLTLKNGEFATYEDPTTGDEKYYNEDAEYQNKEGVIKFDVKNDTTAYLTIWTKTFKEGTVTVPIVAKALAAGDVVAKFSTNKTVFADVEAVIATAYDEEVVIESEGIVTFVEDSTNIKKMKDITIEGLVNNAIRNDDGTAEITLKLKGNYEFYVDETSGNGYFCDPNSNDPDKHVSMADIVTLLNDDGDTIRGGVTGSIVTKDEVKLRFKNITADQLTMIRLSGIYLKATKSCDPGDVAKLTISSDAFDTVKLEVAKMVEEAVTYTVEDDDLPTIWAGKDYDADDTNTLEVSVEENTGDILNTSRKATFTFPDGIEVKAVDIDGAPLVVGENLDIDENVVTIRNYQKRAGVSESNADKGKTDFDIKFVLNAAPNFNGDVTCTLGGEFDDVEFKVATVKAPYTVEAKTSEVLIDYRYVPVNEIVITEAEEGILDDDDVITLQVEKMDFEDAGSYEVTEGDIEVDVDIFDGDDNTAQLKITVDDASTEVSTIVISGLELYLDRTLPVGGYELQNVLPTISDPTSNINILWENSAHSSNSLDADDNGIFKYKEVVCNDSYVEVVTQARDQDDYTTNRKIVITIGATTMAVGTETITLDAPAYINSENYTELPLRAVSEAFGATVNWDDASRTVTIMMGQRIVSMTIGSKTMYINGTPVAMNTAPEITSDRTFVPVRDLANALGISKIDWNEASATVTLN